jgi:hypothetical protein
LDLNGASTSLLLGHTAECFRRIVKLCMSVLCAAAGKDVFWYTKAAGAGGVSNDELEAVKQQERDMMAEVRARVRIGCLLTSN